MKEERVARLERLIEISRSLNSTLSLRPLLHRIVVTAQQLTQTEAASILLVDRRSGQLHFKTATGARGYRMESIIVPMDRSVAGWVAQHAEPLVISDAQNDPRHYPKADEQSDFDTRSILAVPMNARGTVVGVLEALNKTEGAEFTDEDVELLTVLGDQAAVAVQNAILFQQSDLISEIVHEMRTPLTSIISYADLIIRPSLAADQHRQFAKIIRNEAERLDQLAEHYLDLARLESGRASLAQDPVDMNTVTYMAVSVLKPQAEAKRIGIVVDVPEGLPPVVGDAQRLHQVLINLVGNAVKYCGPGDRVMISAQRGDQHLIVRVADTGPGISEEELQYIFKRFYRVSATEDKASGAGLGLAITQQIIRAHNGEIEVSSTEGEGTTFTFTLPIEA